MGHVQIFGAVRIIRLLLTSPWKLIIGTALWKSIVAHGHDLVVLADNTGTHLGIRILGTAAR